MKHSFDSTGSADFHLSGRWKTPILIFRIILFIVFSLMGLFRVSATGFDTGGPLHSNAGTDTGFDSSVRMAGDGTGVWVAVWVSSEDLGGIGTDPDILVSRSEDDGKSWSAPRALNSNAGSDSGADFRPRLETNGHGNWLVVWDSDQSAGGDRDILFSRSTDDGVNWSAPAPVHSNASVDSMSDVDARVASDGNDNWMVVWTSSEDLGGLTGVDQDILFVKSEDNGATWTDPAALNAGALTDQSDDFNPDLDVDESGVWVAAWAQYGDRSDVMVSRSSDFGVTWSAPVGLRTALPPDEGQDFQPVVRAGHGGTWIIVWESGTTLGGTIGEDQDILFSRSDDDGMTWSIPSALNSNSSRDDGALDSMPDLSSNGDGEWIAVWQSEDPLGGSHGEDADILLSYSIDDGVTWTPARAASASATTDIGNDTAPALTCDQRGTWILAWSSDESPGGALMDTDVYFARRDRQLLWAPDRPLHPNAASDDGNDLNVRLASDGTGRVVAVWQSSENLNATAGTDTDIFFAVSTDGGVSWTPPAVLNSHGESDQADDVLPAITFAGGVWVTVWVSTENVGNAIGDDQDILYSVSSDGGTTWSAAAALNTNAPADGMDVDYAPAIAADGHGNWMAVWQSNHSLGGSIGQDEDILFAVSNDDAVTWSAPMAVSASALSDTGGDFDPFVAADSSGRWIVVWMSNDSHGNTLGTDDDIIMVVSDDHGATWTSPTPLNTNAGSDGAEEDDHRPVLATNDAGNWIACWHSEGELNGTVGTDLDIIFSVSSDNGMTWTAPEALNSNAGFDTGDDSNVRLAAGQSGRWYAVWNSGDPLFVENGSTVVYSRTDDMGMTWLPPALAGGDRATVGHYSGPPDVIGAGNGGWVSAWSVLPPFPADGDIHFTHGMVGNPAPFLSQPSAVTIDEGSQAELVLNYRDKGTVTAVVDWGDGTVAPAVVDASAETVSARHSYTDNGVFSVRVDIRNDSNATGFITVPVTVNNVAPVLSPVPDQDATVGATVSTGIVSITDPGAADGHTATVNWGDGTIEMIGVDAATRSLTAAHEFSTEGRYDVVLTVTDDDNASGSISFEVVVSGTGPVLTVPDDQILDEGQVLLLTGTSFTSMAAGPHIASVNWGDGVETSAAVDESTGSVSAHHQYRENGSYRVLVTVRDSSGGLGSDQFSVSVRNAAPVVVVGADILMGASREVQLGQALYFDPGSQDKHQASVDWGDGTTIPAVIDASSGSLSAAHVFPDDGPYTVVVTVTDDDGGVGRDTLEVSRVLSISGISMAGSQLGLTWDGGVPPFSLQTRESVDAGQWSEAAVTFDRMAEVDAADPAGFFRVVGSSISDTGLQPIDVSGPFPSPGSYLFGYDGDGVPDGAVNATDLRAVAAAVHDGENAFPEHDANRDGVLDGMDVLFVHEVLRGERVSLTDVIYVEDDVVTGDPAFIQVRGSGFEPPTIIIAGGSSYQADEIDRETDGSMVARAYLAQGDPHPADGDEIRVETPVGTSSMLRLRVDGVAPGELDESSDPRTTLPDPAGFLSPVSGISRQDNHEPCCITSIEFVSSIRGLRIFAFDETGRAARGNGREIKRRESDPTHLRSQARQVTVMIRDGEDGPVLGQYSFNCDNIRRGEFTESVAEVEDSSGTRVRSRTLFSIVDFTTQSPCESPQPVLPAGITGGVIRRDNEEWRRPGTDEMRHGSGAIARFSVPLASLEAMECRRACWTQAVTTRLEKWNPEDGEWETVFASDWHNDNIEADAGPDGSPWYCYGASFVDDENNLVMGDGPHIVHTGSIWAGGKLVELEAGDLMRRRSFFLTSLICHDPRPEHLLASFLWSVTTVYRHDPDDLSVGGQTTVTQPVYVNIGTGGRVRDVTNPIFRKGLNRKKLRDYLRQKERDLRRCPR